MPRKFKQTNKHNELKLKSMEATGCLNHFMHRVKSFVKCLKSCNCKDLYFKTS